MSPDEARRQARIALGGVAQTKENYREGLWNPMLEEVWQDARFGIRTLIKNPGLTLIAVLSLALATGATTAIFSVVYSVLLRPLPFAEPNVSCRLRRPRCCGTISSRSAGRATRSNRSPSTRPAREIFIRASSVERVTAVVSDRDLFEVLGAPPLAGPHVPHGRSACRRHQRAVWRSRFASDPNVIGSSITLDDQSFTVVGVMPEAFQFPYGAASVLRSATAEARVDVWIAEYRPLRGRLSRLVARLKPGVTADAGAAEIAAVEARRRSSHRAEARARAGRAVRRCGAGSDAPGAVAALRRRGAGAIAACANVANLLLALTSSRMQEVATRAALGASRARLVRQFMIESLLLALAGALAGLVVARWTSTLLVAFGSAADSPHARGRVRLDGLRVSAAGVRRDGGVLRHRAGDGCRARRCRTGGEGGRPRNRRTRVTVAFATRWLSQRSRWRSCLRAAPHSLSARWSGCGTQTTAW